MGCASRRQFLHQGLAAAGLGVLWGCGGLPPGAAPPAKVARLGYLHPSTPTASGLKVFTDAFLDGLRELGYAEGRNLAIEWRWAEGREEQLPGRADELVQLGVDVIVAVGTAIRAAREATAAIPIVFPVHSDPVGSGLVASLARPGGNITGLSGYNRQLNGKRLELLKAVSPALSRLAVIWVVTQATTAPMELRELDAAAQTGHVRVQSLPVRAPEDLDPAFEAMAREGADGLMALASPSFTEWRARLIDLVTRYRLPAVYPNREQVESGGLLCYGANVADLYRRAATYVDKILKGVKPAELPVEQPTKFDLVINLKTAQALGLMLPQSVLLQVTEVIQ